jgi:hypothetical protein
MTSYSQPYSRQNLILKVLRLLSPPGSNTETLSGAQFGQAAGQFRANGMTGIIRVAMPGNRLAWLVYSRGTLVHAAHDDLEPLDSLNVVRNAISQSQFVIFRLSGLAALMSVAVVDGMASFEEPRHQNLSEILDGCTNTRFTGMLGAEKDDEFLIWRWRDGRVLNGPSTVTFSTSFKLVRVDWVERNLPELLATRAAAPQIAPKAAPAAPVAVPSNTDSSDRMWSLFEVMAGSHLGDRAERMVRLLRAEYGDESGQRLIDRLSKQMERIAGGAAAKSFREGLDKFR